MADKPIGTLGTIPTVTIAGVTFTTNTSFIALFLETAGTNRRASFRKIGSGTASGYAPSGVSFYCKAFKVESIGTVLGMVSAGYNDTDLGTAGTTATTNPVYWGTESSSAPTHAPASISTSPDNQRIEVPMGWPTATAQGGKILNAKYGFNDSGGSANTDVAMYVFGYEV